MNFKWEGKWQTMTNGKTVLEWSFPQFPNRMGTIWQRRPALLQDKSSYRSQKPLIVTTNLPLNEIRHPSVVTQTNAVKSPTDSLKATTLVYTVEEIAQMLAISLRSAYNLCNSTTEFRVLRAGGSIRVPKDSFDAWLRAA